jgi:hypothetical protein
MPTDCLEITCSGTCEQELPEISFNECEPDVSYGQVARMRLTNLENPLTDETDPTEWTARMAASGASKIIELVGIGDKPAEESNVLDISLGRKVSGNDNFTINFKLDELSDLAYELYRKFKCGKIVLGWYITLNGKLYGGNKGIPMSVTAAHVIPESSQELEYIQFTFTWKSKTPPCRTDDPLWEEGFGS